MIDCPDVDDMIEFAPYTHRLPAVRTGHFAVGLERRDIKHAFARRARAEVSLGSFRGGGCHGALRVASHAAVSKLKLRGMFVAEGA